MWLLLVAAGTGYLTRCWQNAHKARPVTSNCGQNQSTSPLNSAPLTPRRFSSPSRTCCCNSNTVAGRKILYDGNKVDFNTSHEDESFCCLETPLKHCLGDPGEDFCEQENGNNYQVKAKTVRVHDNPHLHGFEQCNHLQNYSSSSVHHDKMLPQMCKSSASLLQGTDVLHDCSIKSCRCNSYLNSHASSRSACKNYLVSIGVDAHSPLNTRVGNKQDNDKGYAFSQPWPDLGRGFSNADKARQVPKYDFSSNLQTGGSSEFLCRLSSVLNNSPNGRQAPTMQEFGYTQMAKRKQKRNENVCDQGEFISNVGQEKRTNAGKNRERDNFFVASEVDIFHTRSSIEHISSADVEVLGDRLKDYAAKCCLKYHPGSSFHEDASLLYEKRSVDHSQDVKGKKTRGNLQRKVKGLQKFLKGRGLAGRKMAFRDSLKYIASVESCLKAQTLDANYTKKFAIGVSPSIILHPLLCSSPCPGEDTMVTSIAAPSRGMKGTEIGIADKSSFLVLDSEMQDKYTASSLLHSNSKKESDSNTTEHSRGMMKQRAESLKSAADNAMTHLTLPSILRNNGTSKTPYDLRSESIFGFGAGLSILFMVCLCKREIDNILKETKDLVHDMRNVLASRKAHSCAGNKDLTLDEPVLVVQNLITKKVEAAKGEHYTESIHEESLSDDDDSATSVLTEEHAHDHCNMSELEAELEAELELMERNTLRKDFSKHGVRLSADIQTNAQGIPDLVDGANNLPADSDSEDGSASSIHQEVDIKNYMVSATELERRLWEVLQQRQEAQIIELKKDLEMMKTELHVKEEDLQLWKNRVKWLTEISSEASSGENSLNIEIDPVLPDDVQQNPCWSSFGSHGHHFTKCLEDEINYSAEGFIKFMEKERFGTQTIQIKSMSRTRSGCSFSSSESVLSDTLSFEIVTSNYPGHNELINPISNCGPNLHTAGSPETENSSLENHLRGADKQSSSRSSSDRQYIAGGSSFGEGNFPDGALLPNVCKETYDLAFSWARQS